MTPGTLTSVRQAVDRIDAGALGPALTRAVAGSLRRDALAGLRDEHPADAVLERSLARLAISGAAGTERSSTGDGVRAGARSPAGDRAPVRGSEQRPPPVMAPRYLVAPTLADVATVAHPSSAPLVPPPAPSGAGEGRDTGPSTADGGRAQPSVAGDRGTLTALITEHGVVDADAMARATAAARRRIVAPAAVLGREDLHRLLRPPTVIELDRRSAPPAPTAPPPVEPTVRAAGATAPPARPPAPVVQSQRRPSKLADLAAMYATGDPPVASSPLIDQASRWPGGDVLEHRDEIGITVRQQPPSASADDVRLRDSVSRTSPSVAAELAGAAAVVEAVLLHEARRYGVPVEET